MISPSLPLVLILLLLQVSQANAVERQEPQQVQSDISTHEISIQSNFTGIEIVLFGSIDFSRPLAPNDRPYDVVMVVRGPAEPIIVRRKERIAGIWMNGASRSFSAVPGFYAAISSRPLRAIATEKTLSELGIGLNNIDFGKPIEGDALNDGFRAAVIRLREEHKLFQENDNGVNFIGRSLFRGSVALPVNVPVGRYTTQIYLFQNGKMLNQSQGSLQVTKVGFERDIYTLAFDYPLAYGLLAVSMAVTAGLAGWAVFRKS